MSEETVAFVGLAAVPVGHRVEVTVFREESGGGFFGGAKTLVEVGPPRIEDLETGIVYGHSLHHGGSSSIQLGKVKVTDLAPRPDLEAEARTGVVRQCHVISVGTDLDHIETHLQIEFD